MKNAVSGRTVDGVVVYERGGGDAGSADDGARARDEYARPGHVTGNGGRVCTYEKQIEM